MAFDPLLTRRKRGLKPPPVDIAPMAVDRQERLLKDMFMDVNDEEGAQRYSYAKGVQKRQRMRRLGGSTSGK